MSLLNEVKYFVPCYLDSLGLDDKVTFGMEVEFEELLFDIAKEEVYKLPINKDWVVATELSVDPSRNTTHHSTLYGGEVASPVCMEQIDEITTWKELKLVCNKLKELGGFCNDLAGGHIHIGAQIFEGNKNYLANFLKLWIVYESVIYQMGYAGNGPRSSIFNYAKKMRFLLRDMIWEFDDSVTYASLVEKAIGAFDKKDYGINFLNMKDDEWALGNTIEFRYPNGSLIPFIWQNNVNFITKLIKYAKSDDFDVDLINFRIVNDNLLSYSIDDALELANLIFNSDREKLYFLYQYLGYCNSENNILLKTRKPMN